MNDDEPAARRAREAAQWLARLNSRAVTTEDLNAFYEWRRDPDNAEAYARGERLWHDARGLEDDHDIAQAVREALQRPRQAAGAHTTRRMILAGGGATLLAAGSGAWWYRTGPTAYQTQIGEQLLVRLDDGSRMRLNTDTRAQVRFSSTARRVELERGQALFEVAHDPNRPFRVESRAFAVEALGTRFDVSALDDRPTRVLLIDGRIAVDSDNGTWRRLLTDAGDVLSFTSGGAPVIAREDLAQATSWTEGRLTFRRTPLINAIAEVNRYARAQIHLSAPDYAQREVDGVFETGDTATFVSAVTALFPLQARNVGPDEIVLTGR